MHPEAPREKSGARQPEPSMRASTNLYRPAGCVNSSAGSAIANAIPPGAASCSGSPGPPSSAVATEDDATGRAASTRGDQDVLHIGHLVPRGSAHLADALGDVVDAVDVGLADHPAVR